MIDPTLFMLYARTSGRADLGEDPGDDGVLGIVMLLLVI